MRTAYSGDRARRDGLLDRVLRRARADHRAGPDDRRCISARFPTRWRGLRRDQYGDTIATGRRLHLQRPVVAGGMHLPDIYIVKPVFVDGALEAWATTVAHHTDVGGHRARQQRDRLDRDLPGRAAHPDRSSSIERGQRERARLGHRSPPMCACPTWCSATCRRSSRRAWSASASMRRAVRPLRRDRAAPHLRRSARLRRAADARGVREMPDGTYRFADHIDGIGDATRCRSRFDVAVTVAGDRMMVDWTGTSPQVRGGINSPVPFTKAARLRGDALGDDSECRTARASRGRSGGRRRPARSSTRCRRRRAVRAASPASG